MRAVQFITSSPIFSEREKSLLLHKVWPSLRYLVEEHMRGNGKRRNKKDTDENENEDEQKQEEDTVNAMTIFSGMISEKPSWQYSPHAPTTTGSKILLQWRKDIQNFLYDIDFEPFDKDKNGTIFGIRYKRKSTVNTTPVADPFDKATDLMSHLEQSYEEVPVHLLSKQIALGRGVMAYFRPPRDPHYSLKVYSAVPLSNGTESSLSNTIGFTSTDDSQNHPPDYDLPSFMSGDYKFYAQARHNIEKKFLSFEDYLLQKIYNFVSASRDAKDGVAASSTADFFRFMGDVFVTCYHHILSIFSDRKHQYSFTARSIKDFNNLAQFWKGSGDGAKESAEMTRGSRKERRLQTSFNAMRDVIVAVRYRFQDQSFVSLRVMKAMNLHFLPLAIPNPNPAASSGSTFSSLRLARAEFVMFCSIIASGAVPVIYRGLNFSLAHPMLAKAVAASVVSTIVYTSWSSRSKIEIYAKFLIEQATVARLQAQEKYALEYIEKIYVDQCSEAVFLAYITKLCLQRGDQSPSNDEIHEFVSRNSELMNMLDDDSSVLSAKLRVKVHQILDAFNIIDADGKVCELAVADEFLCYQVSK